MVSTTATYLSISNNLAARQAATAASPDVKTATAYYQANIGKVTSISDFVNNYQLFSYAMQAYGLEDMNYAKGLMTQVLQGGTTSSSALANTLGDPRYLAFAKAFSTLGTTQTNGTAPTAAQTTATVNAYTEQSLEDTVGSSNQGAQLALYFQRTASSVTSLYGVLADPSLLKVVQTAFGLPASASEDIDSEAADLGKHVTVADLQDPAKVKQIAEQFTAMWDVDGNNTSSDSASVATLFSSSTATGISSDLLLSLQGLQLGGP